MIFKDALDAWRQYAPWQDDVQVEQDLVLHGVLQAIYADSFLSQKLAFRGGTCLNKLFWDQAFRYSEDLDFVQIEAEAIGLVVDHLKKVLSDVFDKKPQWDAKQGSFRLHYYFIPEDSEYKQRVKIEINTREHFAVKGYQKKEFILDSVWRSGSAMVTTFSLEELLATKLRALYQRRKGRDLFDLWMSRDMISDYSEVVRIYLIYMKRMGCKISRTEFVSNLQDKIKHPLFINDMTPLLRQGIVYDANEAANFVQEEILSLMSS